MQTLRKRQFEAYMKMYFLFYGYKDYMILWERPYMHYKSM